MYHEFVPRGQTVNEKFEVEVLTQLRDAVRRKRTQKWQGKWFMHHDNDTAFVVQKFLTNKNGPIDPQPPYSPDLAPEFSLFPKLKLKLRGMVVCVLQCCF